MNAGSRIQRARKIGLFTGTTFMLSWLTVVLFIALGGEWWTPSGLIVGTVFMFMPMVSTIIVQKIIYKEPLRKPLGISFKLNKWWLVAWLLPPLIAFATIGVSLLIPGISYSPEMTGFFERLRGRIPVEQLELLRAQAAALPNTYLLGCFDSRLTRWGYGECCCWSR
jgi:hypothetical protein